MSKPLTIHHQDTLEPFAEVRTPDPHQDTFAKTYLGFWLYLMTDCLLFASLFCTYAVLHPSTFGGPSSREIFSLATAFTETIILLCSSFACGLAMLASLKNNKRQVVMWMGVCFGLGLAFVAMELHEFHHLAKEGHDWTKSAFLSSFFTLVGTHGLHVSIGLVWMLVMMIQLSLFGITMETFRRLTLLSLFWHFLDVIWIFIFTFVYLMGVI